MENENLIHGIFPKTSLGCPKPDDISDDEWIDYMIGTWCLNSSAAGVDGVLRRAIQKAERENKDEITIKLTTAEFMQLYIDRDISVLHWLYDFWRKEKSLKSCRNCKHWGAELRPCDKCYNFDEWEKINAQ